MPPTGRPDRAYATTQGSHNLTAAMTGMGQNANYSTWLNRVRYAPDCVAKLKNTAPTKISRKGAHRQFWLETGFAHAEFFRPGAEQDIRIGNPR